MGKIKEYKELIVVVLVILGIFSYINQKPKDNTVQKQVEDLKDQQSAPVSPTTTQVEKETKKTVPTTDNSAVVKTQSDISTYLTGVAAIHCGTGKQHVAALCQRRVHQQHGGGILFNRHRFAGQQRFVDLQLVVGKQAHVGGNQGPGFQQHDVARH